MTLSVLPASVPDTLNVMQFRNIIGYKFVGITDPLGWKSIFKDRCDSLALKGTVILAPEGINLALAGEPAAIQEFLQFLRFDQSFGGRFTDLAVKESKSPDQPFGKMVIRVEKEIITMRHPLICTDTQRAPSVAPAKLKQWIDQGVDEQGREVVLLDARNDYEVEMGTFDGAVNLGIDVFHKFPAALASLAPDLASEKVVVSFCTGGIRCEKAALYMQQVGYKNVYQLDGGILKYFEEVGGAHWQGDCFVFDERVAVDPELNEIAKPDGWLEERRRRAGQP